MRSHVDSPRVSVDATLRKESVVVIPQVRTVIRFESVYISFLSIALCNITNPVVQSAAPPRNSNKGSEPVS